MDAKLLIVDAAALGYDLLRRSDALGLAGLEFRSAESIFPAVTCTVQASFRTASPPAAHGMVANGLFFRDLRRVMFWEQSAGLVRGERIWQAARAAGRRVGVLFWQQSLGEQADVVLSPAPIHRHHGGMIHDCYCRPGDLYARLCGALGGKFNLMRYWGPLASAKVGDWIADATAFVMARQDLSPDLLLTYLPTLDYDLQRWGPSHARSAGALARLGRQLRTLVDAAKRCGYGVIVFGDCAMADTVAGRGRGRGPSGAATGAGSAGDSAAQPGPTRDAAVFPNRALRQAGLMSVRQVRGMLYGDLHTSRAFAVADHEVAHVYVRDEADVPAVRQVLAGLPGVGEVLDGPALARLGLDHPNSGQLVIVAAEGRWLAYPWWTARREAPDYARHVDIHNKPGYDPCELFLGWPPMSVSQDTAKVRGSHGRAGPGRQVAWATTLPGAPRIASLLDLASWTRELLVE